MQDRHKKLQIDYIIRGVARGGAEGARAPPEFGRSINPIQTRGADYAHQIIHTGTPGFSDPPTALLCTDYIATNVGINALTGLKIAFSLIVDVAADKRVKLKFLRIT